MPDYASMSNEQLNREIAERRGWRVVESGEISPAEHASWLDGASPLAPMKYYLVPPNDPDYVEPLEFAHDLSEAWQMAHDHEKFSGVPLYAWSLDACRELIEETCMKIKFGANCYWAETMLTGPVIDEDPARAVCIMWLKWHDEGDGGLETFFSRLDEIREQLHGDSDDKPDFSEPAVTRFGWLEFMELPAASVTSEHVACFVEGVGEVSEPHNKTYDSVAVAATRLVRRVRGGDESKHDETECDTAANFRQGWSEAVACDTQPIDDLWDDIGEKP
jgi:hypothetical protein